MQFPALKAIILKQKDLKKTNSSCKYRQVYRSCNNLTVCYIYLLKSGHVLYLSWNIQNLHELVLIPDGHTEFQQKIINKI